MSLPSRVWSERIVGMRTVLTRWETLESGFQKWKSDIEPEDLERHDCVMLNARNNETDWDLFNGRKKARIHVSGPISSRDFNSLSTFVYRGHGIGLLPSTYCDEALASGALIRLLPKWASAQIPVFAVYSNRKFRPSRLKVFLEALAAWKSPLWLRE